VLEELALGEVVELALVEMVMAALAPVEMVPGASALVGMVLGELALLGNRCRWYKFWSDRYCTAHRTHHSCHKS